MHIALIFTYKTSLLDWEKTGLLEREMLFYKTLSEKHNIRFTFITFGDDDDLRHEKYFDDLKVTPIYSHFKKSKFDFMNFII